jgi:hypothetical protein
MFKYKHAIYQIWHAYRLDDKFVVELSKRTVKGQELIRLWFKDLEHVNRVVIINELKRRGIA